MDIVTRCWKQDHMCTITCRFERISFNRANKKKYYSNTKTFHMSDESSVHELGKSQSPGLKKKSLPTARQADRKPHLSQ